MTNSSSMDLPLGADFFNPLDRHFSALLQRLSGKQSPELALAAALVSRRLADGHSCIHLGGEDIWPEEKESGAPPAVLPARAGWEKALRQTTVVGGPGEDKPLILDTAGRLYLQRYWRYEQDIARDFRTRIEAAPLPVDVSLLQAGLRRLFPSSSEKINWQKVAAFTAVHQRFCVITGGPGTGKTWTIARVLALLLQQPGGDKLKVKLAAPTGKAAARLQESLSASLESLDCPAEVKTRLRTGDLGTTLHRLLGPIPNSAGFRHNKDNPLPVHVLVVDEASMISLSLMARLLAALGSVDTRLILVGDKDQLPSVDPGCVLSDICRAASINKFSRSRCIAYEAATGEVLPPIGSLETGSPDTVVQLQVNYRTGEAVALNSLAATANAGSISALKEMLKRAQPGKGSVLCQALPARHDLKGALKSAMLAYYLPVLQAGEPEEALQALGRFRILCAVREGPYGVLAMNRLVEEILVQELPDLASRIRFGIYPGKPVMVTANNYTLKLYNGDTGVFWNTNGGSSLVYFPDESGSVRGIARERLPEHETAYAMTVHKAQGSEFDHVLFILPEKDSALLTRELVYTGLTRAKESLHILCDLGVLGSAIQRQAQRQSGLAEALAANAPEATHET